MATEPEATPRASSPESTSSDDESSAGPRSPSASPSPIPVPKAKKPRTVPPKEPAAPATPAQPPPRPCRQQWQPPFPAPRLRRRYRHGEQQRPKTMQPLAISSRCLSHRPRSHPMCTTSGGTAWPPCAGRVHKRRPRFCPSKVAERCGSVDCLRTGQRQPFQPSLFTSRLRVPSYTGIVSR